VIRSYKTIFPTIPESCYIDESAQVIGDVMLGEQASVWMNAVVRGDVNSIRIGAYSNVQDCSVLHGMLNQYSVNVGEWVTVGHNVTLHGCTIEDTCLIGMGAVILNNVRIGRGSIVAAGTVIPEGTVIEANSLVMGIPGKVRKKLAPQDEEMILRYARNYLDYTKTYLEQNRRRTGSPATPGVGVDGV
jgi:carbonic anhydrase/acetyltransferase-like protein (isoleucine patch superfamily)